MSNRTVNIIVVGFGLPDIETECINSILENTRHPYVLTFIDNVNNQYGTLTQVWNTLIRINNYPYIMLLNNDTKVTKNWIADMLDVLETAPDAAFCGPSTNKCHSIQKSVPTFEDAKKQTEKFVEVAQPLSGFALLFRRSLWEELGGFDEAFEFYAQESDFCARAHRLGKKSYWAKRVFVFHHSEMSIKKSGIDVEKERTKAKKLYWEKRRKEK